MSCCWQYFWKLGLHKYINYLKQGCPTTEPEPGDGSSETQTNVYVLSAGLNLNKLSSLMCTSPRNGKGVFKVEHPVLGWWRWFLGLQDAVPGSPGWRGTQRHHRVLFCAVQSRQSLSVTFKDKNPSVSITAPSPKP